MVTLATALHEKIKKITALIPDNTLHIFENVDHAIESDVSDLSFTAIANFTTV